MMSSNGVTSLRNSVSFFRDYKLGTAWRKERKVDINVYFCFKYELYVFLEYVNNIYLHGAQKWLSFIQLSVLNVMQKNTSAYPQSDAPGRRVPHGRTISKPFKVCLPQ